jgi:hypothetical protein
MAEGSMKVMKTKWLWVGLVVSVSSSAWAATKADKDSDSDAEKASSSENKKSKAHSKKASSSKDEKAESESKKPSAGEADSKDDATKDETADEDVAPTPPPKKVATGTKKPPAAKRSSTLNMGVLASLGASVFTRLGIGLRGGLTLGATEGLYIGIVGTYFTGTSITQPRLTSPPDAERTRNAIVTGVEVGYDWLASDDILVRPYLSPGVAYVSDKTCATGNCWNDNGARLTLAPGLQGIYTMGVAYVGADLRYQIIMNTSDASAAIISLTGGLRL